MEMTRANFTAQFLGEFFSINLLSGYHRFLGREIKKFTKGKQTRQYKY
jgi:hypothetical protein